MGVDFLPGLECHHPADQRLARRRLGTQALLHGVFEHLYGEFFALRYRAQVLDFLLLFRVLQGAGGGGLQPMAQAILADTFPPQQRGLAFALYGITAIMAPTIGPTLGGWITFNYSWRWIFFINLPVGVVTWFLVRRFVEDPPYLSKLKAAGVKLDYIGIALLALGIGALQVLLDKGQEDDWFGSRLHHHFSRRRNRVPDLAGDLGVVSKGADHRRPHVQEL